MAERDPIGGNDAFRPVLFTKEELDALILLKGLYESNLPEVLGWAEWGRLQAVVGATDQGSIGGPRDGGPVRLSQTGALPGFTMAETGDSLRRAVELGLVNESSIQGLAWEPPSRGDRPQGNALR